jgi:hypothetical protein
MDMFVHYQNKQNKRLDKIEQSIIELIKRIKWFNFTVTQM